MAFAVFGKDYIKAHKLAFSEITAMEKKRAVFDEFKGLIELDRHLSSHILGGSIPAQYELALVELKEFIVSNKKASKISVIYNTPEAARKYLEMIRATGDAKAYIKQNRIVTDRQGLQLTTKSGSLKKEWVTL